MDNEKTARRIEQLCLEGGAELKRLRQILNRVGAAYHQSGDWHNYIERRGLENASLAEKEAAIAASERGIEAMHELGAFLAEPRVGGGGR